MTFRQLSMVILIVVGTAAEIHREVTRDDTASSKAFWIACHLLFVLIIVLALHDGGFW